MDFECRAVGKIVPCELETLIEEVFVSPSFVSLVNEVNEKYGIQVKVSNSELIEAPFF
jgi:hypothetical protein